MVQFKIRLTERDFAEDFTIMKCPSCGYNFFGSSYRIVCKTCLLNNIVFSEPIKVDGK
jgi:hypothetical protein